MNELDTRIVKEAFGTTPDGKQVDAYTLKNSQNMSVKVITYGGIINKCSLRNKRGQDTNVVLGFEDLSGYLGKHPRFGSTIGRYANRIAGAQFELNGKLYKLAANKGTTSIHGGLIGFDKQVWSVIGSGCEDSQSWIKLSLLSPDMQEGFPGNLNVTLQFALSDDNTLQISYEAWCDQATPVNLTNHSYFNLNGAGNGNVLGHIAQVNARYYTPLSPELTPTGEILKVDDTPFDFRQPQAIGKRIKEIEGGYDLNYVIDKSARRIDKAATVTSPDSGLTLTCYTDQPGVQFFTANSLDGSIKGLGGSYPQYAGFCLETQHFPDAVHHKHFPTTILDANEKFTSVTRYSFSH